MYAPCPRLQPPDHTCCPAAPREVFRHWAAAPCRLFRFSTDLVFKIRMGHDMTSTNSLIYLRNSLKRTWPRNVIHNKRAQRIFVIYPRYCSKSEKL